MALTSSQQREIARIRREALKVRDTLSSGRVKDSAPTGSFASGGQDIPFRNQEQANLAGSQGEEQQQTTSNFFRGAGGVGVPTLSLNQGQSLAKSYGLEGLSAGNEFAGLTNSQATTKAKERQSFLKTQTSSLTSGTFNAQTRSGLKSSLNDFQFQLGESQNDPFKSRTAKQNESKAIIESFNDRFAKNFQSMDDFNNAVDNPAFKGIFDQYQQAGGDVNDIASKIATPVVNVTGETRNPDGSYNIQYSDGTNDNRRFSQNPDGTFNSNESQTIEDYLGAIDTQSKQKALESLIPEQKIAQQEIAFNQGITEKFMSAYFGTEDQVGFVQQQRKQAEESIKILERKAKLDQRNARAQVDLAIQRNAADLQVASSKVEENRLAAKNYMTGQLAKLGALKTTGAAPLAVATLEQKYKQQAQELQSAYSMRNQDLELSLNEEVDRISITRDTDINELRGDLSKSEEDVWKEVFKMQNAADKETFNILGKYAKDFRSQTEKYEKEATRLAEKNAREFASIASEYDVTALDAYITNVQQPKERQSIPFSNRFSLGPNGEKIPVEKLGGNQNLTFRGISLEGTKTVEDFVPQFIRDIINKGAVSSMTENVLKGNKNISDYSGKNKTKIQNELNKAGISKDMLSGSNVKEDKFGNITAADQSKGLNYLYNNGATPEDIQKFREDREFQSYVLGKS